MADVSKRQPVIKKAISVEQNASVAALQEQAYYEQDKAWPRPKTDITKWDKYCPYQLLVVEAVPTTKTDDPWDQPADIIYQPYKDWRYTLPLPPESLSIHTPFAINTTVTLGGIVEEHNGAPIKYLSFRGTTGFLPLRTSGGSRADTGALDQLERIFAGTVSNINQTIGSINKMASSLTNSAPVAYNVYQEASFYPGGGDNAAFQALQASGFFQMALLRDFFDSYVAIKKKNTALAKKLRLAVCIWKENQVFLVTPTALNVTKSVPESMEYKYSMEFKAWKRVELTVGNIVAVSPTSIRRSPNLLARALNSISYARQAVKRMGALKAAVLGDIDPIFKPFHDTILLCKDTIGASLSLAEIPLAVKQRVSINISELKYTAPQVWNQLTSSQTYSAAINALKYSVDGSTHLQDMPVGARASHVSSQGPRRSSSPVGAIKAALSIKDLPDELLTQIPVSAMGLPQDAIRDINKDIRRVRGLKRKDFEEYANSVRQTADRMAFLLGVGDPTYGEVYGIDLQPIKSEPSQSDWDGLNALNDAVVVLQQFAATADGEPTEEPTFMDRFGGMAVASGIAWKKPVSKFAIPFPYGATLEGLALQYLGDPNRYMEIIALNGLRSPYIDEVGYTIPLLVNGNGQTIVINQSDDLYVGKTVWLSSNAANRTQFRIETIQTVNGVSNVKLNSSTGSYKVQDNAVLESFLSGTVCSRNLVWIPSDVEPQDLDSVVTRDIPGVDTTDPMVSIGGVDLLLGLDDDLVLVDGELRYAIGLANIMQWVRTALLGIRKGELIQHQELGLPLSIGLSLADFSAQEVVDAIKEQLSQDGTFSRIDKITVTQRGSAVSIDMSAVVAGTTQPLPLNYGMRLS